MKKTFVTGYIVPIGSGTRLRKTEPSTYDDVGVVSYSAGIIVEIDYILERTETDAAFPHNFKGDVWGHVIKANHVTKDGYMAIMYHDPKTFAPLPICTKHYVETNPTPDPNPNPTPIFPDSFTLTDPIGVKAEYKFVRIVSE